MTTESLRKNAAIDRAESEDRMSAWWVDSAEKREELPRLSVIIDSDGIEAVKITRFGETPSPWLDESGRNYEPILPLTVLSTPGRRPAPLPSFFSMPTGWPKP